MEDVLNIPQHIAIIMDGNRRWAKEKGKETSEGHKAGADNLEKIAKDCNKLGVKILTVYAFSTENWKRSKDEVSALMVLLKNYLKKFSKNANKDNIKIRILGGELRISNFLPWQLVYSEFYFTDKYWPDFSKEDLIEAIKAFNKRNRKFGGK